MAITIKASGGNIRITNDVISAIVGGSVMRHPGVVSMSSKNILRDNTSTVLRKQNYARGIIVQTKDDKLNISIHIIARFGVKLSEVAKNIKQNVEYDLKHQLQMTADSVSVVVDGIK